METVATALADAERRNVANAARIETLKDVVAFYQSQELGDFRSFEAAATAFASNHMQMGRFLTEALNETLIESLRALAEMERLLADTLKGQP